jgi:fructokinase
MKPSQVICVGEMLVDLLSDRPGLPLESVDSWTDYPGGAPANVACACVKLVTAAGFIGCRTYATTLYIAHYKSSPCRG